MRCIRLIREVQNPGRSGPANGQYALQRALRARAPAWLKIGAPLDQHDIPWFWCWQDRDAAAACAHTGRDFIVGPNVLFHQSRWPCRVPAERDICQAATCRLMFTESAWYANLIEQYRGPDNRAPIVLWPYPIDPRPPGPLPAQHDLLLYAKGDHDPQLVAQLQDRFPRSHLIRYGRYRRDELLAAACRSRSCLYLSNDDRGPLALAEVLLSGCPAIGVRTGAPFIEPGRTGIVLEQFHLQACITAVLQCHSLDRHKVAALASAQFDTTRIVDTVLAALRKVIHPRSFESRWSERT